MSVSLDFNFYVSNLEKSLLKLLKEGDPQNNIVGMSSVKTFAPYAGELDRGTLLDAIKAMAPNLPLVLVCYGSGADKQKAATGILADDPIENEHRCNFVVIVASNDMRGEVKRITNAYKMVGEARQLIGGVQFEIEVEGQDEPELLNHEPFHYAGVETIGRLKDLTAFAVHFVTQFHEWTRDRRVVVSGLVNEILLDIEPEIQNENLPSAKNLPGIKGVIEK